MQNLYAFHDREDVTEFLHTTVCPALERAAEKFEHQNVHAKVITGEDQVALVVYHEGYKNFEYAVRLRGYRLPTFAFPQFTFQRGEERHYYRAEVDLAGRSREADVTGYSQDEIIHDMLTYYETHMQLLQPVASRPYR